MCHGKKSWIDILPTALLGLSNGDNEDLLYSAAELVYDTALSIPGEFLVEAHLDTTISPFEFTETISRHKSVLRPIPTAHHTSRATFYKDLETCSQLFLIGQGPWKI